MLDISRLNGVSDTPEATLARIIHEGRLTSLFNGRIELFVARGVTDDVILGLAGLSYRDVGTALAA